MDKPSIPKGTRDFGPAQMAKRQFIFKTIRGVFEKYGFQPLETPAMENLTTLTGKYGEEGDQLLFRILNSGDFLQDVTKDKLETRNSKLLMQDIADKGLKYDLTVPFARYVVMNRNEITFPFKRYQIQPVWRADRPQKGRYREFYQCDADVVGTDSLVCEAEIVLMIGEVFKGLGITDYGVKINHRGILSALAGLIGAGEKESSLFVAIDKLDKIGEEKVAEELKLKGFGEERIRVLFEVLHFKGDAQKKIEFLRQKFASSTRGIKSVDDVEQVLSLLEAYGAGADHLEFDIALARGLSYYTGCIFEVKVNHIAVGSVSGGGRYDNLTGVFGMPGISGVGFSFGVDRLYDAMEELQAFPDDAQIASRVLVCHLDEACRRYAIHVVHRLRSQEIAAEVYPDLTKVKKQLEYADRKKIPFAIIVGSEEVTSGVLTLKDLRTGEQHKRNIEEIISKF